MCWVLAMHLNSNHYHEIDMKQRFYLILMALFMGAVQVRAQQLEVQTVNEAAPKVYKYAPEACKITFSGGKMLFHHQGTVVDTYEIKDIQRISFYADASSVADLRVANGIVYSSKTCELAVHAAPGTAIAVYRADGLRVLSKIQSIASPTINVAHLPMGTYVLVVGNETFKFVR